MNAAPLPGPEDPVRSIHWKAILREKKIILRKMRGQNFLASVPTAKKIVDLLALTPADVVLEVGPGLGVLTEQLLQRAGRVFAVEIEKSFCETLEEWYGPSGCLEILQEDILQTDLPLLLERARAGLGEGGSIKIVSNLPYYISTPVLTRFLEHNRCFSIMVLTMQKEVADRISSPPGGKQYGSLSVFTQFFCKTKLEFKISPGNFYPAPAVDSAVVSFVPHAQPPVLLLDEALFFRVVRAAFSARRKTLRNSLKKFFVLSGLDKNKSETLLEKCGIDGRRRAETLSLAEFARMANLLVQWRSHGTGGGA